MKNPEIPSCKANGFSLLGTRFVHSKALLLPIYTQFKTLQELRTTKHKHSFPVQAVEETQRKLTSSMKKLICLVLLFVIVAIVGVEANGHGVCGKYSPDRMLTHVLRHCEKPAKDLKAPVSKKCCEPVSKLSEECINAIINSDTWKHSGINLEIASTIPKRCHDHHL